MKKIKSYEYFLEQQIIDYINYSVNESMSIGSIWNNVSKKIQSLSKSAKVRVLKHLMATLLTFNASATVYNIVNTSSVDDDTKKIAIEVLQKQSKDQEKKDAISIDNKSNFKKGYEFSISQNGINHIKDSEKLKLRAYSIGDGKITIGYGHAESVNVSKYKIGDEITEAEAEELLRQDLKTAEDGVRRVFHQWEEKDHNTMINQDMYDAMVSIAYNSGIGIFRKGQFLQELKKGNFKKAGEKIKKFNLSDDFPGLADRREKESALFLNSI